MEEIFRLQRQLNAFTLKNIGLDYEATIGCAQEKVIWIENYRKALSAELAELIREVEEHGSGTQNGRIEIVDMLHFLVSLSHMVGVEPHQVPKVEASSDGAAFCHCAMRTFLALDDLQNSLKWKWWAKGGGFKPDRAKDAVIELWHCFAEICVLFALDFQTVKRIYLAKNELNFARQNRHYNEDTKTEADNQGLEV
jgi:dimeric dUTPase (all-alpha-NTP-PPase superfamily)